MKPSPSPAATQQNEFEKYPELARHIEHFANTATNVSLKDWWALLDALNASLIAASRGTRTPGTIEVCEVAWCRVKNFKEGCYKSGDARAVDCPHAGEPSA